MQGSQILPLIMAIWLTVYLLLRILFRKRLQVENRLSALHIISADENGLDDDALRKPLVERILHPLLRVMGSKIDALAPSAVKDKLAIRLGMAGMRIAPEHYVAWYMLASALGAGAGIFLVSLGRSPLGKAILISLALALVGALLPELVLRQKIAQRQLSITRALPDALDLLTVSVKAGLGFDSALNKVTEKMRGPLPEELSQVLHEIKMGVPRKDSLRALASRTGVEPLQSFVGTVIQADQLGVSISNVLHLQSEALREKRRQIAEEKAMKAPIKMLFPLIIFIFPTLFIVLLGPAAIQIMEMVR